LKVHYAHGGGYTELGGMKTFLTKIRKDIDYEKIFPAKRPRKKTNYLNKDREKRKKKESGVSGKDLFKEILNEKLITFRRIYPGVYSFFRSTYS